MLSIKILKFSFLFSLMFFMSEIHAKVEDAQKKQEKDSVEVKVLEKKEKRVSKRDLVVEPVEPVKKGKKACKKNNKC